MSTALLRSAIWYLTNWRLNPVFCNIFKKPFYEWSHLYSTTLRREDVMKLYNDIIRRGGKPAGVALLPTPSSRVVVLDLDLYRVEFGMTAAEVASIFADHGFVAATTPRGGVRVVFSAPEGDIPSRISILWYGKAIGEGSGSHKHLWHFPPSAACIDVDESGKCRAVGSYVFVLPNRKVVKYPWETNWDTLPIWKWCEVVDVLKAILQVEIVEELVTSVKGELKATSSTTVKITIPCWRDLSEFTDWLNGLTPPQIPLPSCVARALGYAVTEDLRNEYTGEKVPHGMRYTLGAVAVMFLAATVAKVNVEELVDFVGQNLEDYPADEGEPLNTKLSRLLSTAGSMLLPRYSGLGALGTIPPEICSACHYAMRCRTSTTGTERKIPWLPFIEFYWENLSRSFP